MEKFVAKEKKSFYLTKKLTGESGFGNTMSNHQIQQTQKS
jgi:hypothetical protein